MADEHMMLMLVDLLKYKTKLMGLLIQSFSQPA